MGKFDGKTVLVTGTSRGIGKAVAEAFRRDGAAVVAASRRDGFDAGREDDVNRLFAGLGRLDILVNNAGILMPRKPMVEVTTREWDETMAVNLRGVFLCTRAALKIMIPQRNGLIINISSGAGKRAAPEWGAYAVSKWGVEGFTRTVAEEVKPSGIAVVAINPGPTRTAMRALAYPQEDPGTLTPPEALAEFVVALAAGEIQYRPGDSIDYVAR